MKKLILIRHAHRDNSIPEKDNGLSEKGEKQAERIGKFLREFNEDHAITLILSSSKKRCLETVAPAARHLNQVVQEDRMLFERSPQESVAVFLQRINSFILNWKDRGEGTWVACSHGDWLPAAIEKLTGARCETKKGCVAEITLDSDQVFLSSLTQRF